MNSIHNKMIVSTSIDTVALQINQYSALDQNKIVTQLEQYVDSISGLKAKWINQTTLDIYANKHKQRQGNRLATISKGSYSKKLLVGNRQQMYYVSIRFAGLKSYNQVNDYYSNMYLRMICAYLNENRIVYKFTELDIAIDISNCNMSNILVTCTQKTANTDYYKLMEAQPYMGTVYIEKVKKGSLRRISQRSYLYNKTLKDNLPFNVNRFELKLMSPFFSSKGLDTNAIIQNLNRYHIMYFFNMAKRYEIARKLDHYSVVRQREIQRLELDKFRVYPNVDVIDGFITGIQMVKLNDITLWYGR